jgi:hypothetical protein
VGPPVGSATTEGRRSAGTAPLFPWQPALGIHTRVICSTPPACYDPSRGGRGGQRTGLAPRAERQGCGRGKSALEAGGAQASRWPVAGADIRPFHPRTGATGMGLRQAPRQPPHSSPGSLPSIPHPRRLLCPTRMRGSFPRGESALEAGGARSRSAGRGGVVAHSSIASASATRFTAASSSGVKGSGTSLSMSI